MSPDDDGDYIDKVAFVYLADETSPQTLRNEPIKSFTCDHYRLPHMGFLFLQRIGYPIIIQLQTVVRIFRLNIIRGACVRYYYFCWYNSYRSKSLRKPHCIMADAKGGNPHFEIKESLCLDCGSFCLIGD